jgi:hypothetical protein
MPAAAQSTVSTDRRRPSDITGLERVLERRLKASLMYQISRALRPRTQGGLSNTVMIDTPEGKGYLYINFSFALVQACGMRLPRGISTFDPAYLLVKYDDRRKCYIIFVQYINEPDSSKMYPLWETETCPDWIHKVKPIHLTKE